MAGFGVVVLLGMLRVVTDAEYTFASLILLPVLFITWMVGRRSGLILSALGSMMWLYGDIESQHLFSSAWIPWVNSLTRMMTYGMVALLASEVRIRLRREREMARRDELTGLRNRRAFMEMGAEEVDRSLRSEQPLGVGFIDLDNFKRLNDTLGHDAGDSALKATAKALRDNLRSTDLIARLAGDEFAIMLPGLEYDKANLLCEKLANAVNAELIEFPPVTASIGVAWFVKPDRPFELMLRVADELMYEVKMNGKNSVCTKSILVD